MSKHAIIVIKNNNRYLQYYDLRWDSYLFLNCKLLDNNMLEIVTDFVSKSLNIDKKYIKAKYIDFKIHKKFSESAKVEKEYTHYFYQVEVLDNLPSNDFIINNIQYKWFTYNELLNNKRIMTVNSDIVGFIKEFNM